RVPDTVRARPGGRCDHRRVPCHSITQALSHVLGAGAMPESRSVFEAAQDPELLRGLTLVTGAAADAGTAERAPENAASSYFFSAQTEHYRLDWHRFNLKQRLLGQLSLHSVSSFFSLVGDVSSISGSDSDSSDASSESELPPSASDSCETPQIPRSHKVLLRNAKGQFISAYRCVLGAGKASHSPAFWVREPREGGCSVAYACPFPQPTGAGAQDLPPLYSASTAGHSAEPSGRPGVGTQIGWGLSAPLQRGCAG
uniref:Uncharacterized protein n=1 Tax=Malurus cyaneus samueli TaxID=2593467 RepID=A0A8C5U2F1_9PASS